jgi:hypothetical protein
MTGSGPTSAIASKTMPVANTTSTLRAQHVAWRGEAEPGLGARLRFLFGLGQPEGNNR